VTADNSSITQTLAYRSRERVPLHSAAMSRDSSEVVYLI